jgi:hypothetical protein
MKTKNKWVPENPVLAEAHIEWHENYPFKDLGYYDWEAHGLAEDCQGTCGYYTVDLTSL